MTHMLRVYWAYFKISMSVQLQYRVSAVIWMLGAVIQPAVYLVVWVTVAREQGGSVGGLSVADFSAYYLTLMFVEHLTFTWIMWEYDYRIREGQMSRALLLPIHPIHSDITDNIAFKLLGLVVLIPGALLLAATYQPAFEFQTHGLLFFIPAFLLAFALRFLTGYSIALIAFWTDRISAINGIYFVLALFFSGRLTPLELLPPPLQTAANLFPFKWYTAYPVELFLGRVSFVDAWQGLIWQGLWVIAAVVIMQTIWRRGVRKYAAYGS